MPKPGGPFLLLMSTCPSCGGPTEKAGEDCLECREYFAEIKPPRRPGKSYCDICGEEFGNHWQAVGLAQHKWEAHGIPGEVTFNGRTKRFGPPPSWWGRQSVLDRVLYVSIPVGAVVGAFTATNPVHGLIVGAVLGPTVVGGIVMLPGLAYLMVGGTYSLIKKGLRVLFRSAKWLDRFLDP